jgi:hypothetical protein
MNEVMEKPMEILAYGPAGLLEAARKLGYDGSCAVGAFEGLSIFGASVLWVWDDKWKNSSPVSVTVQEGEGNVFTVEEHGLLDKNAVDKALQWQNNPRLVAERILLAGRELTSQPRDGDVVYKIVISGREKRRDFD